MGTNNHNSFCFSFVSYVFYPSLLRFYIGFQSLIVGKNESLRKQILDDPLHKLPLQDYRYLIFPINSVGNSDTKDPYHWTVLVCDNLEKKWIHYNSLKPRGKQIDPYLKDATLVVSLFSFLFYFSYLFFVISNIFLHNRKCTWKKSGSSHLVRVLSCLHRNIIGR